LDLHKQRYLTLSAVRILVLDEADEMLDMGFLPDVERIVAAVPTRRQTMLFSATMPGQIISLARRYMSQPIHIRAQESSDESSLVDAIEQHVWRTHPLDKPELVSRILQAPGCERTIVFCRTKRAAQKLADDLEERGFTAGAIHGDLGQGAREKALGDFRAGKVPTLVATDVAARGIDVEAVTHVINYECPDDDKTYTHRIGRTGRAGASGVAITFVDWPDTARWQMINRALGLAFNEPIETYSSSDHVYTGLNIPRETKGRLKPPSPASTEGRGDSRRESAGGQRGGSTRPAGRSGGSSRSGGKDRPSTPNRGAQQPRNPESAPKNNGAAGGSSSDSRTRQRRRKPPTTSS
jgi:superfamily II DNA/RNA helicase